MSIKKLRKRKDENIISGIGEKGESFLLLFCCPLLFLSLSFFLFDSKHNPHIPPICLYHSKIKIVFFKVDNLNLSSTIIIFLKRRKIVLHKIFKL